MWWLYKTFFSILPDTINSSEKCNSSYYRLIGVLLAMFFLSFLSSFILLALIVSIILICFSDADLSLAFCDKFTNKLGRMRGRVVWITGASMGIGAELAVEAAKNGAKLVLSARSKHLLKEVKRKCLDAGRYESLSDRDVLVLPMDVTDVSSHRRCVDTVISHFGKISVLLLNAGKSQRGRWEHISLEVDEELFKLNVFSAVHLTRLVLPIFAEKGSGIIGVMSSVAGKVGAPFSASYTASKHALHGYFETLRSEKAGTGISVVMLCPGPTFSNLLHSAATEETGQLLHGAMSLSDRRMSTQRCAHLCMVAIANEVEEAWIAIFPVLPILYFAQYAPTFSKRLMAFFGVRVMQRMRDSAQTVKTD